MASIFGHFVAGFTTAKVLKWNNPVSIFVVATFSAFLPDIDVIGFKFDIPYDSMFGHRGITHSFLFALIWGGIISLFYKTDRIQIFIIISLATATHPILDAMTTGGLGVAFFAPFENSRYFFPFRPIKVSPISVSKFFSEWGLKVIVSELLWVALPCATMIFIKKKLK